MTNSITPPRELMEQWASEKSYDERDWLYEFHIATRAAQWGADQQLAEDAEWLNHNALNEPHLKIIPMGVSLKEAMRPKPPSLRLQALNDLNAAYNEDAIDDTTYCNIRRALEALPE